MAPNNKLIELAAPKHADYGCGNPIATAHGHKLRVYLKTDFARSRSYPDEEGHSGLDVLIAVPSSEDVTVCCSHVGAAHEVQSLVLQVWTGKALLAQKSVMATTNETLTTVLTGGHTKALYTYCPHAKLTAAHSPYQIALVATLTNGETLSAVTYVHIGIIGVPLYVRKLPTSTPTYYGIEHDRVAQHNRAFVRRNNKLIRGLIRTHGNMSDDKKSDRAPLSLLDAAPDITIALDGNAFRLFEAEMYDNSASRIFAEQWSVLGPQQKLLSKGARIPIVACPAVQKSNGDPVIDRHAVGEMLLRWEWIGSGPTNPDPHEKAAPYLKAASEYRLKEGPDSSANVHVHHGGQRPGIPFLLQYAGQGPKVPRAAGGLGSLMTCEHLLEARFPFNVVAHTTSPPRIYTTFGKDGSTGAVFMPGYHSGDSYIIEVTPCNKDQAPLPGHRSTKTGVLRVTRRITATITVGKKTDKNTFLDDDAEDLQYLFQQAGVDLDLLENDTDVPEDDTDLPEKYTNTSKIFQQSLRDLIKDVGDIDLMSLNGSVESLKKRAAYKAGLASLEKSPHALEFVSFGTLCDRLKEFYGIDDDGLRKRLADNKLAEEDYPRRCDLLALRFVQKVATAIAGRKPGVHLVRFDRLTNLESDLLGGSFINLHVATRCPACSSKMKRRYDIESRVCSSCGMERRGNAVVVATHPFVEYEDWDQDGDDEEERRKPHLTIAHEIGHALGLSHAPFPANKPPPGSYSRLHVKGDTSCVMSYNDDEAKDMHFCGLCALRLRGWSLGPSLDKVNPTRSDDPKSDCDLEELRGVEGAVALAQANREARQRHNLRFTENTIELSSDLENLRQSS